MLHHALLLGHHAFLADISDGIENVGGGLVGAGGAFGNIIAQLGYEVRPLFLILGIIMIAFAGLRQVIGQEDSTDKLKTSIILVVFGLILAYATGPFIDAFYQQGGAISAAPIANKVLSFIDSILGLAMPVALLSIIIGAVLGLANATSEEGISKMRAAMVASVAGLVILAMRLGIAAFAISYDAGTVRAGLASVMNTILGYVGICAILSLIIAGLYFILSWGREDTAGKGKGLAFRVVIGIAIILLSVTVIQTIANTLGNG